MKKKVLVSSLLTIALCFSLIVGATFALFTSNTGVNVAVSSGKVEVVATVDGLTLYSARAVTENAEMTDENGRGYVFAECDGNTFANGGTATVTGGNSINVANIAPGDKFTFTIDVANNSNINILYRTVITCEQGDLFAGLKISIGDYTSYDGFSKVSNWTSLAPNADVDSIDVSVELPMNAGDEFQNKTCKISYMVEAVQGNANVDTNDNDTTTYIYTKSDLITFANSVNNGESNYKGKTVKLAANIDFGGDEWTPVGQWGDQTSFFAGTFDGQGHTISNMNIVAAAARWNYATGFFGITNANGTLIKNVNFDGITVRGNHWTSVIVGYLQGEVSGCTVKNSKVLCTYANSEADGDKAGAIVGYVNGNGSKVVNNTVENVEVYAVRDIGGVAGTVSNVTLEDEGIVTTATVEGNTVKDVKLYYTTGDNAHKVVGRAANGYVLPEDSANTTDETVIINKVDLFITNAQELVAFGTAVNSRYWYSNNVYQPLPTSLKVVLADDIDLAGIDWVPMGQTYYNATFSAGMFNGCFDGQGYTIKNMSVVAELDGDGSYATGFFGWIGTTVTTVVKNIVFDNATVKGHGKTGVVAGYLEFGSILNCTVKNSTVICSSANDDADGDKAGGIVGQCGASSNECCNNTVESTKIYANRDVGGITGAAYSQNSETSDTKRKFENNSVKDVEIYYATEKSYGSAGEIISGRTGMVPSTTNTATDVTITMVSTVSY